MYQSLETVSPEDSKLVYKVSNSSVPSLTYDNADSTPSSGLTTPEDEAAELEFTIVSENAQKDENDAYTPKPRFKAVVAGARRARQLVTKSIGRAGKLTKDNDETNTTDISLQCAGPVSAGRRATSLLLSRGRQPSFLRKIVKPGTPSSEKMRISSFTDRFSVRSGEKEDRQEDYEFQRYWKKQRYQHPEYKVLPLSYLDESSKASSQDMHLLRPASGQQTSSQAISITLLLKILLFLPWCVIVGATILIAPRHLPEIAFRTGYFPLPSRSPAIQRLSYYGDCALYHVLIFIALVGGVMWWWWEAGVVLVGSVVVGFALAWGNFRGERGGSEQDREVDERWMVWKMVSARMADGTVIVGDLRLRDALEVDKPRY